MARVLITDYVFPSLDIEHELLGAAGIDVVVSDRTDEESLVQIASDIDGMLVCFAQVTPAVVRAAAAGGCKVIARYGIGYDNIAVDEATRNGIVVTNVPDYCLDEVADHTLALLLAMARGIVVAAQDVAAGEWRLADREIHRLAGRRLALLGLGGIGRRVATRARAFGLEVTAYDPFVADGGVPGVTMAASIEDAVGGADFVSLHVPMTPENHHLINSDSLALMSPGAVLINTARGGLVDTDAVTEALDGGRLGGVALDVTEEEPLPQDHPLRTDPRAVITPHIAYHSIEATEELQRRAASEVVRVLANEQPERPVNPNVLADR